MLAVFQVYPTFTAFLAVVLGAALVLVLMPPFIRLLRRDHIGQEVRDDGPQTHLVKQGTPTMGGVVMLVAVAITVISVSPLTLETAALLCATLLTGALGLADDASKVIKRQSLGLTPKAKLAAQFAIAIAFCLIAVNYLDVPPTLAIPFGPTIDLGVLTTWVGDGFQIPWLYLIFVTVLIAGMSNATNLTDGLDGLAAGTIMVVMVIMAAIAFRTDMLDGAVLAAAIAGACIGFLWFNSYPADIFMGDTGSLALGTAFSCLAVITKTEVVSLVIGGLFVAEALSVIIQVMHYKRTKKRLFLMAPLHHHFEKKGWSEVKVVIRFWIISGTLATVGFVWWFSSALVAA
ncbi:phospho-N-acetylmuramoyl-pentapeptide-transferase [Curtanaerobium respiraculi]|uniref:phospho-N-acetylmuramoyl-pentapeptide- transferase n=1 Tax=Curtanaerobium respiraculi TaxID=2949669 RepID=UPI0024B338AA|nr:phospho-N-acetylmuramoyl-pentapeptide-transferase [Curtanaerobium respiraculi]